MSSRPEESCELCRAVDPALTEKDPLLVHEFGHSILRVGSHQYFKGYCVLVAKTHTREPFDLPDSGLAIYQDLMAAARAIQSAFSPFKINYGSYGNQVPHLHWHLFPRYLEDPKLKRVPWLAMPSQSELDAYRTTDEQARVVAAALRPFF